MLDDTPEGSFYRPWSPIHISEEAFFFAGFSITKIVRTAPAIMPQSSTLAFTIWKCGNVEM